MTFSVFERARQSKNLILKLIGFSLAARMRQAKLDSRVKKYLMLLNLVLAITISIVSAKGQIETNFDYCNLEGEKYKASNMKMCNEV
jgi:hypothetical protein